MPITALMTVHGLTTTEINHRQMSGFPIVKLLQSEIELLNRHEGCQKCHRFYVKHCVPDCNNGFPDPRTYVMLTAAMALQARNSASDTESEELNVSPTSVPHYIWHANVHGNAKLPIPFDTLLDNGAHLVLIRPEAVIDLGLPVHKLKEPQRATLAINSVP